MKDIVSYPLWIYLLSLEKCTRTEIIVFNMIYTDAPDYPTTPALVYHKLGGTIARTHIAAAFRSLEKKGIIRKVGSRKNEHGKDSSLYNIVEGRLDSARDYMAAFRAQEQTSHNGPDSSINDTDNGRDSSVIESLNRQDPSIKTSDNRQDPSIKTLDNGRISDA